MPAPLEEVLAQARDLGFLGDGPLAIHISHSLELAECVERYLPVVSDQPEPGPTGPGRFLDLGTGGGIPGLVLAALWPTSHAVLLDASQRRTDTLSQAIEVLGWGDRVRVVRDRAETVGRLGDFRDSFDVVVARSFGPPPMTAECGSAFLHPGGLLVVSEPPTPGNHDQPGPVASDGERWPPEGVGIVSLVSVSGWRGNFGFQVLRRTGPLADTYPRRNGVPAKRPIYRVPRET